MDFSGKLDELQAKTNEAVAALRDVLRRANSWCESTTAGYGTCCSPPARAGARVRRDVPGCALRHLVEQ